MIPKIIHYMWFDKKNENHQGLPSHRPRYSEYFQNWKTHNPNFTHRIWNNQQIHELFKNPELIKYRNLFYKRLNKHIEKCDFTRYAIMYLYGGIYVDLDFDCKKSFDDVVNRKIGLVREPDENLKMWYQGLYNGMLSNSLLMSEPGHPFWLKVMDYIDQTYSYDRFTIDTTGTVMLSKLAYENQLFETYENSLLDTCLFEPINANQQLANVCKNGDLEKAYCLTLWNEGSLWLDQDIPAFYSMLIMIAPILFLLVILVLLIIFTPPQ